MESANLHHHHQLHEHQLALSSSSSSSSSLSSSHNSSSHGAATSPDAWTQCFTLNTASNNFNPNCNGVVLNPSQKNESLAPTLSISTTTSMIQDLSFHQWNLTNNAGTFIDHDLQLSKTKQQLSDSFLRFTNMSHYITSPTSCDDHQKNLNDLREKLLLKTISSGFPINGEMPHRSYANSLGSLTTCMPSRGHFSQIYPSINISNLNQSSPPSSSSSNSFHHMNFQALDLLTPSTSLCPHDDPNLSLFRDTALFNLDRLNPTTLKPSSCIPSKVTSYTNQITQPKRPNSLVEPKPAPTPAPKKPRVESRVASPPFKVRKEKLGDRIAALQQLVAPFGKTDTASVLMEAIGYIKFLQNQVETLSVPYMKSSRRKSRSMQGVSVADDGKEEAIRDLRSRGLCLVPLSCMSYVTADSSGGGMWPAPNFGGGT